MTDFDHIPTGYNDPKTGRFQSGNSGRPKGARNKLPLETMQKIQKLTPAAMAQLEVQVNAGNFDAVKWVLERIVGKSRFVELAGDKPTDISDALVNGEISTDEAKAISTVLEKLRRIEDLDAVVERLAALEKLLQG